MGKIRRFYVLEEQSGYKEMVDLAKYNEGKDLPQRSKPVPKNYRCRG